MTPTPTLSTAVADLDFDMDELQALCDAVKRPWYGTLQISDGITDEAAVAFIEAFSPDMVSDLIGMARSAAPAPSAEPVELSGVREQIAEGSGFWRECSGCYETEDGHSVGHYPYSNALGCPLGGGCSECGGIGAVWDNTDYEAMGRSWVAEEEAQHAAPASDIAAAPEQQFGQEVTRLVAEIRKPCSMARRDSLVEELIELIDPQAEGASAAPGSATAGAAAEDDACPACGGSGESMQMVGGGPDAHEEPCTCPHCDGKGGLRDAYDGVVKLLSEETEKYLRACGKLAWSERAPAEVSPPDGAMPEPWEDRKSLYETEVFSKIERMEAEIADWRARAAREPVTRSSVRVRKALEAALILCDTDAQRVYFQTEIEALAAQPAEGSVEPIMLTGGHKAKDFLPDVTVWDADRVRAIVEKALRTQPAERVAQVAMPRELVQRVYDRLCKAQIFPLAGEVRKVMDAIPEGAAPERSDTPADPSALLTDDKRAAIREAVRKAFPDYAHSDRMMDQLIWNTEQACVAAASKALDAAPAGLDQRDIAFLQWVKGHRKGWIRQFIQNFPQHARIDGDKQGAQGENT